MKNSAMIRAPVAASRCVQNKLNKIGPDEIIVGRHGAAREKVELARKPLAKCAGFIVRQPG